MTLRQMRYFVEICKCDNNITKAAELLYVTQPSVSTAIHSLEKELGYPLFIRNGKRLILTQNGEYVLDRVTSFLESADSLKAELLALQQKGHTIRLGLPLHVGAFMMPIIFGEFSSKYPNIHIELVEAGGLECIDLLEAHKLDLAISVHGNYTFADLHDVELFKTRYCFCVNKQHPLAQRSMVSMEDLRDEPLVMMPKTFYINTYFMNLFAEKDIKPNIVFYTKQLHTVKNMIANNIASAFLMRESVLYDENIVGIPLKEAGTISVQMTLGSQSEQFSEVQTLVEFLLSKNYQ